MRADPVDTEDTEHEFEATAILAQSNPRQLVREKIPCSVNAVQRLVCNCLFANCEF